MDNQLKEIIGAALAAIGTIISAVSTIPAKSKKWKNYLMASILWGIASRQQEMLSKQKDRVNHLLKRPAMRYRLLETLQSLLD